MHRDIKPSNLLVDERGSLWLTDFGLASVEAGSDLTMTGDLLGTLRYMSPEQTLGSRVVLDHRTDIYSLGVTLYELLTLQPAFDATDRGELLRQIAEVEPRPPRRIDAGDSERSGNNRAQGDVEGRGRPVRDGPTLGRRPAAGSWKTSRSKRGGRRSSSAAASGQRGMRR